MFQPHLLYKRHGADAVRFGKRLEQRSSAYATGVDESLDGDGMIPVSIDELGRTGYILRNELVAILLQMRAEIMTARKKKLNRQRLLQFLDGEFHIRVERRRFRKAS